jgi:large subunit ribosomal protein L32
MTPLPKRKTAKARQGERRSHLAISPASLMNCPQCNSPKLPHHACLTCGNYDGREAVKIKSPKKK